MTKQKQKINSVKGHLTKQSQWKDMKKFREKIQPKANPLLAGMELTKKWQEDRKNYHM